MQDSDENAPKETPANLPAIEEEDGEAVQALEDARLGRKGLGVNLGLVKGEVSRADIDRLHQKGLRLVEGVGDLALSSIDDFFALLTTKFGTGLMGQFQKKNIHTTTLKAIRLLEHEGLAAHPVPDRTLLPILEGCAREDDDMLQDLWAALLAKSGSGCDADQHTEIRTFSGILAQLSPIEAEFARRAFRHLRTKVIPSDWVIHEVGVTRRSMVKSMKISEEKYESIASNLTRLGIFTGDGMQLSFLKDNPDATFAMKTKDKLYITVTGYRLLDTCEFGGSGVSGAST